MYTHLLFKPCNPATGDMIGFLPQHWAWVLQGMPVADDVAPEGNGSEMRPWRMSSIGQWAAAAKTKLPSWTNSQSSASAAAVPQTPNRGLYLVGGRLLERSPEGGYSNYITDVVDGGKLLFEPPLTKSLGKTDIGRPRGFQAPVRDANARVPVYDTKYERIMAAAAPQFPSDDQKGLHKILAQEARMILAGTDRLARQSNDASIQPIGGDELPGTVAALFLAEVAREPRMLVLGLMLLDLIERGAPGFTWQSLMCSDTAALGGGVQHPMIHDRAQKEAVQMFATYNNVTKKSVSIMVEWFFYYLSAKRQSQWRVMAVADDEPVKLGNSVLRQLSAEFQAGQKKEEARLRWDLYDQAIVPALKVRASSLDYML